jgi:hypothetical protein
MIRTATSSIAAALLLTCACISFAAARPADGDPGRWAVLVAGISGEPELQTSFLAQLKRLRSILEGPFGFARDRIVVLAEDPARDTALVQFKSTRENLEKVCRDLAPRVQRDDLVFVFILGHGSAEGSVYKLNLVGPDPTAGELAKMLYAIPSRHFVIVNTTTCSGASLPALSRAGSVVLTATRSGFEKNQTHLAEYFIEGLEESNADRDKNGRISLLEAFNYAALKVSEYYAREGILQTEHPVLDDNGDSQAHDKPEPDNGDGLLARTTYLDRGAASVSVTSAPSEARDLMRTAEELEKQIENLKYRKPGMPADEYERQLEALLLKLAQVNAKLQKK